ncbi:MAG: hypothetical protein DRJ67_12280 [Thermoprotei archaeon]|nr:MAG: hypothetical protein DRJ67_12280 [Thermoprotei archaeon]
MEAELEARLKEKLTARVYTKALADLISKVLNIPKDRLALIYEPRLTRGVAPDLVLVHDNIWVAVEFKLKPSPNHILFMKRIRCALEDTVKPRKIILVLAYTRWRPDARLLEMAKRIEALYIVSLEGGKCRVIFGNP